MRSTTQDECRGVEMANRDPHDLQLDLERTRGARHYDDVAREGNPISFGDAPLRDPEAEEILDDSDSDADREPQPPTPEEPPIQPMPESCDEPGLARAAPQSDARQARP
eukprot:2259872-Pyramimonas_sp.AAC.1